jgi:exopolysaccharide production protein ExoQ
MALHIQPTIAGLVGLSPRLALLGAVIFAAFLYVRDVRQRPNVTGAVWLPVIWVVLMGSKSIPQWLHILHIPIPIGSQEEGNPSEAFVHSMLIIGGLYVLNKRVVSLSKVFENNGWLMAFLLYCFVAILWSDFPFVAFKRWIKLLGHPIMALVILTEPDPDEALVTLFKRSAYFLVTASILVIKYYPNIGLRYDDWSGVPINVGIAQSKNHLGGGCMVLGLFLYWHFLRVWRADKSKARRDELRLVGLLLVMIGWLLHKSHDATATLCLLIGIGLIFLTGRRWIAKEFIGTYVLIALVGLLICEFEFGILDRVGHLTGHLATLLGRKELWRECLAIDTNPVFGAGYDSFWLGDRLRVLSEGRPWTPNEAHNGYLEIYLNLGWVGVFMLFALIIATFRRIRLELFRNPDWGRFELAFLAALVFYNLTEATFRGFSLTFFIFFIITMEYPVAEQEPASNLYERDRLKEEEGFVFVHK